MEVKILTSIAGHAEPKYDLHHSFSFVAGETATLHPDLAAAWIASGIAEALPKPEPEAKPKSKK